jgi:membrane protease YdiL (CAAX protease family)
MTDSTPTETSDSKPKWSGFGCAALAFASFAAFAVVQVVVLIVVLFRIHPEASTLFAHGAAPPADYAKLTAQWMKDAIAAPYLFLYSLLGDGAMVATALALAPYWLPSKPVGLGFKRPAAAGQLWLGAFVGIGLIVASDIVSGTQAHFFGSHPEKVVELMLSHHGTVSFILDLMSVAVIAPIAEELLFRGVVFAGLAQRMPVGWAVVLSGLIFGAAHVDLWSFVPLATIGMGLALLYRRTGSLWPNVIAHATVNLVALVAVYAFPQFAT